MQCCRYSVVTIHGVYIVSFSIIIIIIIIIIISTSSSSSSVMDQVLENVFSLFLIIVI